MHQRLKRAGFIEVGEWCLDGSRPRCDLRSQRETNNILYAFVAGDRILYAGKTTIALRDRMYQYQNPGKSQRTNIRVNADIASFLADGSVLKVVALSDPGNIEHAGFHVNLAAGIEDSVISQLKPEWNLRGK